MRAAVLVADGVSARNFLLGPLGRELHRHGDWVALHGLRDGYVEERVAPEDRPDAEAPLGRYDEAPLAALLRYTLLYGHMEWCGTTSMRHNLSRPVRGSRRASSGGASSASPAPRAR